jgi:hypothetical protein
MLGATGRRREYPPLPPKEGCMVKVIWLLKRKDGITPEQFRNHYENSHVKMAHKYLGHLMIEYRRNYKGETWGGGVPTSASGEDAKGGGFGPIDWEYDCIAEWVMPNQEALDEINRIFADPVIGKEFNQDEEHFLDRGSVLMFKCNEGDVVDNGTGDGHATLALTRKIGEPV